MDGWMDISEPVPLSVHLWKGLQPALLLSSAYFTDCIDPEFYLSTECESFPFVNINICCRHTVCGLVPPAWSLESDLVGAFWSGTVFIYSVIYLSLCLLGSTP